jgi:hypothetical protein
MAHRDTEREDAITGLGEISAVLLTLWVVASIISALCSGTNILIREETPNAPQLRNYPVAGDLLAAGWHSFLETGR